MSNHQYLLDTNILSDLIRNPQGVIAKQIAQVGEDRVCTSIIVASELRFGGAKHALTSGSSRLLERVDLILSALDILPLDAPTDREYAVIRADLEQLATPIGPNDLLIAAHALSYGLTVVTANSKEFKRVANLAVVDWLSLET
ncbi:MAG: type II toxin-antitoxin system VapC family toxin [Gammaproteobacteria bacterium]|nr:type II toxin-antitoxin system VapC family toxin [Gammaproteobacteria bacterium]